ncbi:MAG: FAD-dependent oxidoreductase [Ignavibacteriota bacterium]
MHIFYRRTAKEMPAFSFEYDRSKLEGVRFHWLAQPIEIVVHYDRAVAVRFIEMRLGDPGRDGRRIVDPRPASEYEIPCDMVIPALGQKRLMSDLLRRRGVDLENGVIVVDRSTGRTANPRYYAGGDCVNGGREVVDAVADGKRAAVAIMEAK